MSGTMDLKRKQRCRGISLIISGSFIAVIGFFVGHSIIPKALIKKTADKICVDSKQHSGYKTWIGSLSDYSKEKVMKIRYWNITNKDGFLYRGEKPIVNEIGPYIYQFSSMKSDIVYDDIEKTVKYKSLTTTKFDATATKAECQTCSENDKISIMNAGYIGMMLQAKGDQNFAMGIIPPSVGALFTMANQSGYSRLETLQQFGNFTGQLLSSPNPFFPTGWFPAGFGPWLALHNNTDGSPFKGILANTNRTGYNLTEMLALTDVITKPELLGTTGNTTLLAACTANPNATGCGFLYYLNVYRTRASAGISANDSLQLALFIHIQNLFCPAPGAKCLSLDAQTLNAIAVYITDHLAKFAIFTVVDRIDFGPVLTRTVKQISHGFVETRLPIPNVYPNGFPMRGFLPFDEPSSAASKANSKYYTCKDANKAFQYKEYADSTQINAAYYPLASADIRRVEGYSTLFGYKNTIASCRQKQPEAKKSYTLFDNIVNLKFQITKAGDGLVHSIYTHKYAMDSKALLKYNNITVFREGLIDISKMSKGAPLVASMPHFLHADPDLVTYFNMKPVDALHNTFYSIEPVSGIPFKLNSRSQLNIALPEITIQAARQPPFNITYKEKTGATHYSNVVPLFWLEIEVAASKSSAETFSVLYNAINGSCASMIVGPVAGGLFIIFGIILLSKSFKVQIQSHGDF